jgi:hypothetical protein
LRVVWEHVKAKIKGGPRRSRTEAFLEWAHDHPGDVYAIQEADAERATPGDWCTADRERHHMG